MNKTPLFTDYSLSAVLLGQSAKLAGRVGEISVETLMKKVEPAERQGAYTAAMVEEVYRDLCVNPLVLDESAISVEMEETKADVSHDFDRMVFDRTQPFLVDALRVRYYVPYKGDAPLWELQPSTFTTTNPRVAEIRSSELVLEYDLPDRDVQAADRSFKEDFALIKQYLDWAAKEIAVYNDGLRRRIAEAISQRQERLQAGQSQIESLGYATRRKPSAPLPSPRPATATPVRKFVQSAERSSKAGKANRRFEYDVALSYAGEDREYVEAVATALKANGVRVFYDRFEESALWGRNLPEHFAKVYGDGSRFIVLFISEHYAAKAWPTYERRQAVARAIREPKEVVILPVRLDETPLPEIDGTHYVNGQVKSPAEVAAMIVDKMARES